ncbi:jg23334 [Pararge aegeria aegeria]|uniref:Jg23334 protein n=1 Tax=Pararge aegeria aegeria TaxID=348720 RepID=A0A8S4QZ59_9NEOP|nr:jg23334 [Pararge aegeria aegeria]
MRSRIKRACLGDVYSLLIRGTPDRHSISLRYELGTRKQNALYESMGHQLRNGTDPYDALQFDGTKGENGTS